MIDQSETCSMGWLRRGLRLESVIGAVPRGLVKSRTQPDRERGADVLFILISQRLAI